MWKCTKPPWRPRITARRKSQVELAIVGRKRPSNTYCHLGRWTVRIEGDYRAVGVEAGQRSDGARIRERMSIRIVASLA